MAFTVGELARLTGVTVRTLHHYDEIGLVQPSARSDAGYRLYGEADVRRLQQVLVYRELGLPLDDIAAVIDRGNARATLEKHREMLVDRRARLDAMIRSLDAAIRLEGQPMSETDVTTMFDGFDPHAEEARDRWGETDTYKEAARRTRTYGPPEWQGIQREAAAIYARFAELMHEGAPPADARVQGVVAAHRAHIDRWFYPCTVAMQKNLAALYTGDPRFAENIDATAPGLAQFVAAAITAQP